MEESLAGISEEIIAKVLQGNATRLYHLEPPVRG
jgi:predicted TIM-barrel fold metal-dependent hydrolase